MKKITSVILSIIFALSVFSLCAAADEANPCSDVRISVAVAKNIDYGTNVTIKAKADGVPAGYYLAIYVIENHSEKLVSKQEGAGEGTTVVSYNAGILKGEINYVVKVIDADGNVQQNDSGKDLVKDAGTVKCLSNFIKIISAFFRSIFGKTASVTVEPQA